MASELQPVAGECERFTGGAQVAHQGLQRDERIHLWTDAVPFGGHLLVICACGCPGPFVLSVGEADRIPCGVAQAWREGQARLAICGDRPRLERNDD